MPNHKICQIYLQYPSDLDETEHKELATIYQTSLNAGLVYELTQDFMRMLRHLEGRTPEHLVRLGESQPDT
jgi:hypothetical protein